MEEDDELFDQMWAPVIKWLFPEDTEVTMTSAQLRAISRNMFDIGLQMGQRLKFEGIEGFKTPSSAKKLTETARKAAEYKVTDLKLVSSLRQRQQDRRIDKVKQSMKPQFVGKAKNR